MDFQSQNTGSNPNDFNEQQNGYSRVPFERPNGLSHAAKSLAIASLFASFFGFGFILGSLAIIFAILTRDRNNQFTSDGKSAVKLGIIGIVLSILFVSYYFYYVMNDPTAHAMLNQKFMDTYNMSFDDYLQRYLSGSFLTY